ncbi:MAG: hypothetical protein ACJ8C4_09685 [Gemmataceae bacterium]
MITVTIGNDRRQDDGITDGWIQEQIGRRRADGNMPHVTVEIAGRANVTLSIPSYPGGVGRRPNDLENQIFGLWRGLELDSPIFTANGLVAFIKGARRLL